MTTKNKKIFSAFLLFLLFSTALNAWAGYKIEVGLPDTSEGTELGLLDYLKRIYLIAMGSIGVIALLMIVIGGFIYMLSDTVTSKEKARSYITGAISGLILALAAWLILYTINPDLVNWNLELLNIDTSEIETPSIKSGDKYGWRPCPSTVTDNSSCCGPNETLAFYDECVSSVGEISVQDKVCCSIGGD